MTYFKHRASALCMRATCARLQISHGLDPGVMLGSSINGTQHVESYRSHACHTVLGCSAVGTKLKDKLRLR